MKKDILIYSLSDPREPDKVRYIGKTKRGLTVRLQEHLQGLPLRKCSTHKDNWLCALLRAGIKPAITLLIKTTEKRWHYHERRLIAEHKALGHLLTNSTDGGEGMENPSEETRKKLSVWQIGRKMSAEACEKMRKAATGRRLSDAAKAKVSAAGKGRKQSAETIAKRVLSRGHIKPSPQTIAKMRQSHLGVKQSKEQIEKRTAKLRGQKRTLEQRARIAASVTGRIYTEEMRAAMSAGQTGLKRSAESIEKRAAKLRGRKMAPGVGFKRWATRRANEALA